MTQLGLIITESLAEAADDNTEIVHFVRKCKKLCWRIVNYLDQFTESLGNTDYLER